MSTDFSCKIESNPGFIPAPMPADELARLEELNRLGVLDTPVEERFDRIVKLASKFFNTPIAYVSLVDGHRQWFKSRIGIDAQETPRAGSFCGYAILEDQPLIINDARRDLRFAGSPLVIGAPFVRFYAGQPLRSPNGFRLGTLCVLDVRPRTMTANEISILQGLGAIVEHELVMHEAIEWQRQAAIAQQELDEKQKELSATVSQLRVEKQRADSLLQNILPDGLAEELRTTGTVAPVCHEEVAVMFADFSGFTAHSASMSPSEVVAELDDCFCHFDWVAAKHDVEKLKSIGDGYLVVAGMPKAAADDALRLLRVALEIRDYIDERASEAIANGKRFWGVRIGLHIGPLVAGIVGVRKLAYDVWGDTVNTASRIESAGEPGRINVSRAFHDKVSDLVISESRGELNCKGKGAIEMFFINDLKLGAPAAEPAS
jgi:adenylate cyclase